MNEIEKFNDSVSKNIDGLGIDTAFHESSISWISDSLKHLYSYNFTWLGRPIIQYPQDMVAIQELLWTVKPDLVIETGIAHGGSLILSASILALLDMCDATEAGTGIDPQCPGRRVLGIDIDIRSHNRAAIEAHPLAGRIDMIQGSSIDQSIITQVRKYAEGCKRVFICLDSNHTHEHVLAELNAYAPLTGVGSYCVVFDTLIEDLPEDTFSNRPWGRGNNPKTAAIEYLRTHPEFEIDRTIENKLQITVAPGGYLKRIR